MVASIPTKYNGTLFRSRLEAKWAAFFDLVKWKWEYEPCDFAGWLPDFALYGKDRDGVPLTIYVEVKPTIVFMPDVAEQINNSGCMNSVLLIGETCMLPTGRYEYQMGWFREYEDMNSPQPGFWWDPCSFSVATGGKIGITSIDWVWRDKLSGVAGKEITLPYNREWIARISEYWARARNVTQWHPQKPGQNRAGNRR